MATDPRGLTRHGQGRKAELLSIAERLFIERGYQQTRMIDIAQQAGVTKGLVYWYFDTKEALFREVARDLSRRLRRAQGRAIAGVENPLARVYLGTAESVRFVARHHRIYAMISAMLAGDRRLRAAASRSRLAMATDVGAVIAQAQDQGLVHLDDDPAALAFAGSGVVTQYVLLYGDATRQEGGPEVTVEDVAHAAARYVVRALSADRAVADEVLAAHGPGTGLQLRVPIPSPLP